MSKLENLFPFKIEITPDPQNRQGVALLTVYHIDRRTSRKGGAELVVQTISVSENMPEIEKLRYMVFELLKERYPDDENGEIKIGFQGPSNV